MEHTLLQPFYLASGFSYTILFYWFLLTIVPSAYLFFRLSNQPLTLLSKRSIPPRKIQFTNGMVVIQSIISIILIIGTIVYSKQLSYITKTANINKNLIEINASYLPYQKLKAFKDEIVSQPNIVAATISCGGYLNAIERGYEDHTTETFYTVDNDFIKTHNLSLIYGENFTSDYNLNKNKAIVNETFVKSNGIVDPIGKPLSKNESYITISGVVADFYTEPFNHKVKPIIIYQNNQYSYYDGAQVLQIKLEPNNISQTVNQIQNKWHVFFPNKPFDYDFIIDKFSLLHVKYAKTAIMIRFFSFISIFLTAFGLLGLTIYSTRNRTKEIGIRKVNGAKISEILTMLNKDFVKWVVIAFIIATPLAYYIMNKWLENFCI